MKKWLALFAVVLVLVVGWYVGRTYWRITPEWDKPKLEKVVRGDIRVPITAAGLIEPYQRIEIKPEASGEVIEVKVVEGDFVKTGDVLVVLKRTDEERNVDKAKANLDRAEALLAQANVAVERAKANIDSADAQVDQFKASKERAQYDYDRVLEMAEHKNASPTEQKYARINLDSMDAQLRGAMASAKIARQALKDADESIKIQQAIVNEASKDLEEAKQRLSETTIISKHDAIITDVQVKPATVVQSGKSAFGGTVLLTMADVSKLKVVTRVDEADYGRVSNISPITALPDMPGLQELATRDATDIKERTGKVTITVDAFPHDKFEGVIERVEPQGKLNAGAAVIQFDVHVQITDPNRSKLPLGTQAQVEFTVESVQNELVVPADAVKTYQEKKGVYVKSEGGDENAKPRFVACRFGITDGAITQVVEPLGGEKLEEGMMVYTKLPADRTDERR